MTKFGTKNKKYNGINPCGIMLNLESSSLRYVRLLPYYTRMLVDFVQLWRREF